MVLGGSMQPGDRLTVTFTATLDLDAAGFKRCLGE